jgi:FkbM family methyltransferase
MRETLLSIYKKIVKLISGHKIKKFYLVKVIHSFLLRFFVEPLKSNFVEVNGQKMFLDEKDSLSLSIWGIFEEFETKIVKEKIKKGDVVLDIGANIGYYTLIFAKLVGEKGKVFAFEPDPTNFSILKKNIEINGYKNVVLAQKAISDKNGKIKLYICEDNRGDHRIYDSHNNRQSIEIEAIRLDDYFKDYNGNINFIKMDIQGAEGGATQGMSNILQKNNLKVISEFWPMGLKKFGIDPEEYLKLLTSSGFRIYEVDEQRKEVIMTDIQKLLKMYSPEKDEHTNLLLIKD